MTQWASVYKDGNEKDKNAKKVLQEIHDTWWLVNIVDNDYISDNGVDIFTMFKNVIADAMTREQLRARMDALEIDNGILVTDISRCT